jgi:inorganic pyrophosphatase
MNREFAFQSLLSMMNTAHPWHGVSPGAQAPRMVESFIEIVPTDVVKYELDKETGHLRIDRPHNYSSHCPTLYGFVPQTYCGLETGKFCAQQSGKPVDDGDGDPLDICVLTECNITHGNIFVSAIPIGGLRMIDGNKADDKIIAVLKNDVVYGKLRNVLRCPAGVKGLINRLRHYFLSYKRSPDGQSDKQVEITHVYGRAEAFEVIARSRRDYLVKYGCPEERLELLRRMVARFCTPSCAPLEVPAGPEEVVRRLMALFSTPAGKAAQSPEEKMQVLLQIMTQFLALGTQSTSPAATQTKRKKR